MNPIELAFGLALVVVLTGLAIFFGWRQWHTQALLQQGNQFSPIERDFLRGQVRRRTLCCVLLAMLAALLVGWFFLDTEGAFGRLGHIIEMEGWDEEAIASGKNLLWFYTGYVIFALILLMVIIALAAADLLATARYGLRHKRKLLSDHQALLALEAARLKQRRQD